MINVKYSEVVNYSVFEPWVCNFEVYILLQFHNSSETGNLISVAVGEMPLISDANGNGPCYDIIMDVNNKNGNGPCYNVWHYHGCHRHKHMKVVICFAGVWMTIRGKNPLTYTN